MKIKMEVEVSPEEAADFLQKVAEKSGQHKTGPNSRVQVGEKVVAIVKGAEGGSRNVDQDKA
jgi:hypothetical protein